MNDANKLAEAILPQPKPLYRVLASAMLSVHNCKRSGNEDWLDRHLRRALRLAGAHLPDGGGLRMTSFCSDKSDGEKLVFVAEIAHHHEGNITGFSDHTVTVRPSLWKEFNVTVSGRDVDGSKEAIREAFEEALHHLINKEEEYANA